MRKKILYTLIALAVLSLAARPLICFTVKDFKIKQIKCRSTEFEAIGPGEPIEEPTEYVIPTEWPTEEWEEPTVFPTDWYWQTPTQGAYPSPEPFQTQEPYPGP